MNVTKLEQVRRRRAISGILASIIMFAMVFTVGIGFFVFVNTGSLQASQANQQKQQALQQASQEGLSIRVGLSTKPDWWGNTRDLWLRITNVGSSPVTVIDVFVTNTAMNRIMSNSMVTKGTQYLATFSLSEGGDLNYSLPLTILPGFSTAQMSGCGSGLGCDIAISQTSYNYMSGGSPVVVSVLTSTGNVFSAQYPPSPGATSVTTTKTISIKYTSTVGGGNPGGNVLVVQMVANPQQTFKCGHCLNVTVTVYNYGNTSVTGVSLSPAVPLSSLTGTATVTPPTSCTLINGSTTIPEYPGSGPLPKIVYHCTFGANPNGFGGFASFTGRATGEFNGGPVTSGQAVSNAVQIGGPVSVLNQGPFSGNFFFFKYSACTSAVSGGKCTTTPSPLTFANLPAASLIKGSYEYVAFYIQITNNYNVTLPILPYTYFMTDPSSGGESPFFIVGDPGNVGSDCQIASSPCNPNLPSIPSYSPPTLTAYPSTCIATSTASCINILPGGSAVLTMAACDIGSTYWDWAGYTYGSTKSSSTCTTAPPNYQPNEATYLTILVTFVYEGQVYTQQIPFVGQTVT